MDKLRFCIALSGVLLCAQCSFVNNQISFEELDSMQAHEIEAALAENPTNSAYLYEKGTRSFSKSPVEAVYLLHKAVRYAPRIAFYRTQLNAIETALNISQQLSIPRYIASDAFFLAMLGAWLVLWICFALKQFVPWRILQGGMLCCICLIGLGFGLFLWTRSLERAEFDVVFENGARITKIPSEAAQNWVSMPLGTALYTHERVGDFIRVSNGKAIDGWIHRSSLLKE